MRLSRRGWNNVLIFAVLTIIFIFNFAPKLVPQDEQQYLPVINNQLTIVEIKTPDFKIARVGRHWQSQPDLGLSQQQLTTLVHNWQHLALPVQEARITPKSSYIISIYSADQAQPTVVNLIQQDDGYQLQTQSNHALFLATHQLPLLLGR